MRPCQGSRVSETSLLVSTGPLKREAGMAPKQLAVGLPGRAFLEEKVLGCESQKGPHLDEGIGAHRDELICRKVPRCSLESADLNQAFPRPAGAVLVQLGQCWFARSCLYFPQLVVASRPQERLTAAVPTCPWTPCNPGELMFLSGWTGDGGRHRVSSLCLLPLLLGKSDLRPCGLCCLQLLQPTSWSFVLAEIQGPQGEG